MILLDTHIWVWLVDDSNRLTARHRKLIAEHELDGLGVCVMSCWEVAKLVEKGRLELDRTVDEWVQAAAMFPHVQVLPLTPEIAVASTQLPGDFHQDPADQIIVATARTHNCPLLTADSKLLSYSHVNTLS